MIYTAHIPLAGGFALGNMNIIGKPPEFITSYTPFELNDKLLRRYLFQKGYDIPYYQLDKENFNSKTKIDFVCAIPPCNALSQAAQRAKGSRGTALPNEWMYRSARFILGEIQPTVYAFENAPGLWTSSGDIVREKLILIGEELGYAITFYKTNTIKHGIPQFRPRAYGIFLKGKNAPILNYYNRPMPHITEYLKQIPKDASYQDKYMNPDSDINEYEITKFFKKIYGNDWRNVIYKTFKTHLTSYDYLKRQGLLEEFNSYLKTLPNASEIVKRNTEHVIQKTCMGKNFRLGYRILGLDRDYVYAVISEMMNRTLHPIEDRLLNIREYLWLMGLPMDYELEGPQEYPKITQNIPVNTCADITTEIVEIINGNRRLSNSSVYMQDNTKDFTNKKNKSLF